MQLHPIAAFVSQELASWIFGSITFCFILAVFPFDPKAEPARWPAFKYADGGAVK
jgi:hypothetical protein